MLPVRLAEEFIFTRETLKRVKTRPTISYGKYSIGCIYSEHGKKSAWIDDATSISLLKNQNRKSLRNPNVFALL
jgi:hypothetical protein